IVLTMRAYTSRWIWLFFLWAALICLSQVYVGVHYPFDVFSGAVLGSILGYIIAVFFNNYAGLISLQNKSA
ncbi:MAG TPA: phosphatase PAP2 family protein, partial [Chitinophagaceae bacterium]|nr:phosphatase PAP2 family protein [Chitinophagaceae bacterium]